MSTDPSRPKNRAVLGVLLVCLVIGVTAFALQKLFSKPAPRVADAPVTVPETRPESARPGADDARTRAEPPPRIEDGKTALVRGRVRLERGAPVARAGVRLSLEHGADPDPLGETTTDAQGAFAFTSDVLAVAFGTEATLRIVVEAEGYRYAQARYPLAALSRETGVEADVVLAAGALLTGRVLRPSQAPAAGADVTLHVERQTGAVATFVVVATTPCAADGTYRLSFDSGGTYRVTARADGVGTGVIEKLALEAGRDTAAADIVLAGGAPIAGRVVSESGDPIPYLELWAIDGNYANEADPLGRAVLRVAADERDDGITLAKTTTGADGTFALAGLRPGHYALRSPDRRVVMEPRQGRYEPGTNDVRLVVSSQRLLVRVVDTSGAPARHAAVRLTELGTRIDGSYEASGTRTSAVNDASGRASFSLDAEAPVALTAFDERRRSSEEIVMLARNEWTREMTLVLSDATGKGRVRFDVMGEDGRPLSKLRVAAQSSVTRIARDELTDMESDDTGLVDGVPAGTYHFLVGYAPGTSRDHFVVRTTEPVVVRANEETIVPLRAKRGGRLRVALEVRGAFPAGWAESSKLPPDDRRDRFGVRITLTPAEGGAATVLQFRPLIGSGLVAALLPGETLVSDVLVTGGAYDVSVESNAFAIAGPLRTNVEPGAEREVAVAVVAR